MINLLTPEEKDKLKLRRAKSLVVILSGIVLVSLLCLVFILLIVKFSILNEVNNQKSDFEQAKEQYQSQDAADLKKIIKRYNDIMPQALTFYQEQVYFGDILASISEISNPQGLRFDNISLSRKLIVKTKKNAKDPRIYENEINVIISGKSDSRDDLLLFKKNIESQSQIKNVSFSQESWVSPKNINFNLTLDFLPDKGNVKNAN
jgi:hypothetical protein